MYMTIINTEHTKNVLIGMNDEKLSARMFHR